MSRIYKICEQAVWRAAESTGHFRGSPADARDGFIHFSTAAPLAETRAKHFAGASDLMLVALGGCTAYDVVNILTKKRKALTSLDIEISAEQESDPPWTYRKIHMVYALRGKGLDEKSVADAIDLSKNKYCSVGATLAAAAEITYEFTIEEDK